MKICKNCTTENPDTKIFCVNCNSELFPADSPPHLQVENIHKYFGGVRALEGVSLIVTKHKLTALIGPNGSGKTTLFNVITGWTSKTNPRNPELTKEAEGVYQIGLLDRLLINWYRLRRKELPKRYVAEDVGKVNYIEWINEEKKINYNIEPLDGLPAHEIALKGLLRTFQTTRNWPKLTVLENLLVAPFHQTGESIWNLFFRRSKIKEEERRNTLRALEILEFLEISHIRDHLASELSGGQLKLLALGRILMTAPQVILLDEPLAGVNPSLGLKIMDKIIELKDRSTIFLIEHDMNVVFNYSDEIFVMASGKVIAHGPPKEIETNRDVIEAYLGEDY